jgi:D-glycero-D-manno-heptose 1,7-bisphosphate phosphatase
MDLDRYRLIIFDADGTLRKCTIPDQPCPNKSGEWVLLPNVKEIMEDLAHKGVLLGIASNQKGVALGHRSERIAYALLKDCFIEATKIWPVEGAIQLCPHGVEENCLCRKPRPGMLNKIMDGLDVQPEETLMVGDQDSDREASENAGCSFMWAKDFFSWND